MEIARLNELVNFWKQIVGKIKTQKEEIARLNKSVNFWKQKVGKINTQKFVINFGKSIDEVSKEFKNGGKISDAPETVINKENLLHENNLKYIAKLFKDFDNFNAKYTKEKINGLINEIINEKTPDKIIEKVSELKKAILDRQLCEKINSIF